MALGNLLILYLLFRLKQVTCDWLLQNSWMASEKGKDFTTGGYKPLLAHAGIHGVGTLIVVLIMAPGFWWLAPVDTIMHGAIDRITAVFRSKNHLTPENKWFWWSIGIDQEAHNLTHLAYILLIFFSVGAAVPR